MIFLIKKIIFMNPLISTMIKTIFWTILNLIVIKIWQSCQPFFIFIVYSPLNIKKDHFIIPYNSLSHFIYHKIFILFTCRKTHWTCAYMSIWVLTHCRVSTRGSYALLCIETMFHMSSHIKKSSVVDCYLIVANNHWLLIGQPTR